MVGSAILPPSNLSLIALAGGNPGTQGIHTTVCSRLPASFKQSAHFRPGSGKNRYLRFPAAWKIWFRVLGGCKLEGDLGSWTFSHWLTTSPQCLETQAHHEHNQQNLQLPENKSASAGNKICSCRKTASSADYLQTVADNLQTLQINCKLCRNTATDCRNNCKCCERAAAA